MIYFVPLAIFSLICVCALAKLAQKNAPRNLECKMSIPDVLGFASCIVFSFLIATYFAKIAIPRIFVDFNQAQKSFLAGGVIYVIWLLGILIPQKKLKDSPQYFLKNDIFSYVKYTTSGVFYLIAFLPILALIFFAWEEFLKMLEVSVPPQDVVKMFAELEMNWVKIFAIFDIVVLAPVVEEILFRGSIYPILKARVGTLLSALITSILFSAIHLNWYASLPIFVLSLILILLYEKFGDIRVCIGAHLAFNAMNVLSVILRFNI